MSPLILLIGFIFLSVGLFLIHLRNKFFQDAEAVSATLIGIEEFLMSMDQVARRYYSPIIEYTYDGKTYQFKAEHHLDMSKPLRIGQSIDIFVSRQNPTHARIKGQVDILFGIVFSLGGIAAIIAALYVNSYTKIGLFALGIALAGFLGILLIMKIRLGSTRISDVFTAFKDELSADNPPYAPPLEGDPDRRLLTEEELLEMNHSTQFMTKIVSFIFLFVAAGTFYLGWQLGQDSGNIQEKLYISWGMMGISTLAFGSSLFHLLRQRISPTL